MDTTGRDGLHVVFGASGGTGGALVRALAARGKRVRAVSRGGGGDLPAGVEAARGDATDPERAREAVRGAAVVYHAANVPYPEWAATLPRMMDALIGAAGAEGAKLIYADNLYMYGTVEGPMREDLPNRPNTRKGRLRADLADTLLAAHRAGRVRAAIGRSADLYGPKTTALAGGEFFEAVLAGKTARWAGSLDHPHTLTYVDDAGAALTTLGEREEALGEVWHVPSAPPVTGRAFVGAVAEAAGTRAKPALYTRPMLVLGGIFSPLVREFAEMTYQFDRPFVLDTAKYDRVFGDLAPTPVDEGIARTVAWHRARAGR